jgi:hypothetical protein
VKRELERIEILGETEARGRAWNVVAVGFAERQPVERPSRRLRVAVAVAVVVAALAAALSSPGQAVLDEVREVVGVERAQPALFSLPAPGQLLVASDAGLWVVQQDGSKRLLGPYREASWSPFGRFVVAARENELVALTPDGEIRWTLARPGVDSPRWTGTEANTRIAYLDRTGLRVIAGDGTDDQLVAPRFSGPFAWRPGGGFILAYSERRGHVTLYDAARQRILRRSRPGRVTRDDPLAAGIRRQRGSRDVVTRDRIVFRTRGLLEGLTRSPNERWLLVGWPDADQWLFLRSDGSGLRAVANVSEQFRSRSFPRVEGWCCVP